MAALTKALAVEWGSRGVLVNAIAPGVFRTSLNQDLLDGTERGHEFKLRTPLGRFGRVEELAGAAVFLASEAASFVNGEVLVVDGGFLASSESVGESFREALRHAGPSSGGRTPAAVKACGAGTS